MIAGICADKKKRDKESKSEDNGNVSVNLIMKLKFVSKGS